LNITLCKGAFAGAVCDRQGWLVVSGKHRTVFLDEIGELQHSIQVELLRVLQTQEFSRVGETETRKFEGKFILATNRELELEMQSGRFREDLYYRLHAAIAALYVHDHVIKLSSNGVHT
jgi:transcriptional regulator with GAF, ATPase, and Fis domain